MLKILYGLMIMKLSEILSRDIDSPAKFDSWNRALKTTSIKLPVSLYDDVTFFCNRVEVSWWKRVNLRSANRQLISTRNGKVLKPLEEKYQIVTREDHKHRSQLILKNATVKDEGYYECECIKSKTDNDGVIVSSSRYHTRYQLEVIASVTKVWITVKETLPSVTGGITRIGILDADQVPVLCEVRGVKPKADIGIAPFDLLSEKKIMWRSEPDGLFTTSLSGYFTMTTMLDQQIIFCWAANGISNVSSDLTLLELWTTPRCVSEDITVIKVSVGRNVLVNCTMVNAHPPIKGFKWSISADIEHEDGMWSQNSAFVIMKVGFDTVYSEISCIAENTIGSGKCYYQLQLGGIPDPPFGCSSTQTNTTLTIACKAGFHQGDPDYFCYLESLEKETQHFVEIARKKQSCVFLLTDFHPRGLHTFRLYTENRHGSNKANSIILRIGEEKGKLFGAYDSAPISQLLIARPNKRWKALSISITVIVALSVLVVLCLLVYRFTTPANHVEFASFIGSFRDLPSSPDHTTEPAAVFNSNKPRHPGCNNSIRLQSPDQCDNQVIRFDDRRARSCLRNQGSRSEQLGSASRIRTDSLSHSSDLMSNIRRDQHEVPFNLQRRSSDSRSSVDKPEIRLLMSKNKSLTFDNVSVHCRPCKCSLYNPRSEDSLLCEHKDHQRSVEYRLPSRTCGGDMDQNMARSTPGQTCFRSPPAAPDEAKNRVSLRCDDGGVFV